MNDVGADLLRHIAALDGLASPEVRAAYLGLILSGLAAGFVVEAERTAITAVKYYDAEKRYRYAYIVNKIDLLFYLRKPSLQLDPELKDQAMATFGDVNLNAAGEVTIRICSLDEAVALSAWLFGRND